MPTRWERLAGDTGVFAIKVAFMDDPDEGHPVDPDLWTSWGALQIWVQGTNLCAHLEEGETVESAHWYLLPLLEWFVQSWDPMLHEERLPCANNANDGWTGLQRNSVPDPALDEQHKEAWEAAWQQWWSRHAMVAASEGGVFPDVVFRRYRDLVEVSWGHGPRIGVPEHVTFLANRPGAVRLKPTEVAEPLYESSKQPPSISRGFHRTPLGYGTSTERLVVLPRAVWTAESPTLGRTLRNSDPGALVVRRDQFNALPKGAESRV